MSEKNSPKTITFKQAKAAPDALRPIRRSEQHGIMYNAFREVFYRKELSLSARSVAIWLYDHLNPGGNEATGSQDLIAADLGITSRTVRSAVKELYRAGIIISIARQQNSCGGFFNSYKMRIYQQKQRNTRKMIKLVKPVLSSEVQKIEKVKHNQQVTEKNTDLEKTPSKPKVKNSETVKPVIAETSVSRCQTCQGTRWLYFPETRSSKPCPTCKKR